MRPKRSSDERTKNTQFRATSPRWIGKVRMGGQARHLPRLPREGDLTTEWSPAVGARRHEKEHQRNIQSIIVLWSFGRTKPIFRISSSGLGFYIDRSNTRGDKKMYGKGSMALLTIVWTAVTTFRLERIRERGGFSQTANNNERRRRSGSAAATGRAPTPRARGP